MARLGVVAGVRGNAEALAAVLAALERRHVTRLLCAGDIVGYNADPAECAAALRERRVTPVCGRDDLIAVRRMGFDGCTGAEIHSLKRTRRSLTPEAAAWLRTLPTHQVVDGAIALVHAGVRDIGDPMSGPESIRDNAAHLRYDFPGAKLCFFGRGAAPLAWEVDGNVVRALPTHQVIDGTIALVHAGVRDIGDPMSGPGHIRENAGQLRYDFPGAKLCFFGRGDAPLAWELDGNVVRPLAASGTLALERSRMHFIHPGCVDAQGLRGAAGSRSAAFAIFDTLEWTVEFARVPYDAASTEAKAAVFGYRMTALAAGWYALQRGLLRIPAATLPRSGGYAPARPAAPARRGSASTP